MVLNFYQVKNYLMNNQNLLLLIPSFIYVITKMVVDEMTWENDDSLV